MSCCSFYVDCDVLTVQENAAMNAALDKHEGCNIHGWLEVQRVAGNFHLSVHADHYFAMRSVSRRLPACVVFTLNQSCAQLQSS